MNFIYSGNFAIDTEVDTRGTTRVLMGINPTDFRWRLEPGESFQTPEPCWSIRTRDWVP